jgi:SAM-dependent methyltransferase
VLAREGDAFRVADDARPHLLGVDGTAWSLAMWRQVPQFLRDGRALLPPRDLAARGDAYARFVDHLATKFAGPARSLAEKVAPRLPAGARVLDVGAGAAPWSLALLAARDDARLVTLDLPGVSEHARAAARRADLDDRVETLAGDYHSAPLPQGVDAVLLANVLHLESPGDARALVARTAATLKPGGLVVIIDMMDARDDAARALRAAYALHLALRVPGGYPHAETDLRGWLKDAGCTVVERIDAEPQPGGALIATRGGPQ